MINLSRLFHAAKHKRRMKRKTDRPLDTNEYFATPEQLEFEARMIGIANRVAQMGITFDEASIALGKIALNVWGWGIEDDD